MDQTTIVARMAASAMGQVFLEFPLVLRREEKRLSFKANRLPNFGKGYCYLDRFGIELRSFFEPAMARPYRVKFELPTFWSLKKSTAFDRGEPDALPSLDQIRDAMRRARLRSRGLERSSLAMLRMTALANADDAQADPKVLN